MGNIKKMEKTGKSSYAELNALVAKAIEGDKDAFAELCKKEAHSIVYSCLKQMNNRQDGEDAAQEVFVQLQLGIGKLISPEAYTTWIQKIIRGVCIKMRQKSMNSDIPIPLEDHQDELVEADRGVIPTEYLHDKERCRELSDIVNGLPEQTRDCLLLYYFNDLKVAEISDVLGVSVGTVKKLMYVGRNKIKAELEKREGTKFGLNGLLPLSALSKLYMQEMADSVAPSAVIRCLKAVGIIVAQSGSAAVKITGVLLASAGVLASIFIYFASHQFVPLPSTDDAPQHYLPAGSASWIEDTVADSTAVDAGSLPGLTPSGPGKDATEKEEAPPDISGDDTITKQDEEPTDNGKPPQETRPDQDLGIRLSGQLEVENAQAVQDVANLFGNQYYATLEQDGEQLAMVIVDSGGGFVFENFHVDKPGKYTLNMRSIYSDGLVFTEPYPQGTVEVSLVPEQDYVLKQAFVLTDTQAPNLAVTLLDEKGENTAADPREVSIEVRDSTRVRVWWQIEAGDGLVLVASGEGTEIEQDVLEGLAEGWHTLQVWAEDALGNQSIESRDFYIR